MSACCVRRGVVCVCVRACALSRALARVRASVHCRLAARGKCKLTDNSRFRPCTVRASGRGERALGRRRAVHDKKRYFLVDGDARVGRLLLLR